MKAIRALFSMVATTAILGGFPALLIVLVGNPVPKTGLHWDGFVTNDHVIGLLAVIGWVVWAQFVVCFVIEAVAEFRVLTGRSVDWVERIPGTLGGQQQLARILVHSIAAIGIGTAAVATPIRHATAAETPPAPPVVAPVTSLAPQASTEVSSRTVTVERGDNLWDIAVRHLGAGERWREVARLNEGRRMGGGRTFTSAATIEPGWELLLPGDASVPQQTRVVERGDSLWRIAEEEYADGAKWARIYQANDDQIEDPDLIYPGQVLEVPRPKQSAGEETGPLAHEEAPLGPGTVPAPAPTPAPTPTSATPTEAPESVKAGDDDGEDDQTTALSVIRFGGLVLGAGVVSTLFALRRTRNRNRPSGRILATPPADLRQVERALREDGMAGVPVATYLDDILRELALKIKGRSGQLPEVAALRIDEVRVDLLLKVAAADPPHPWVATSDGLTWSAAREHQPGEGTAWAPYPTLVTIGSDKDALLLVDLEAAGALHIDGPTEHAVALARFVAAELATSQWAHTVSIDVAGLDDVHLLNQDRVTAHTALDVAALTKAASRGNRSSDLWGLDTLAGRLDEQGADGWFPEVGVTGLADPPPEFVADVEELQLQQTLSGARCRAALVVATAAPLGDSTVRLRFLADGRLRTPWGDVTPNQLSADEVRAVARLLGQVDQAEFVPGPAATGEAIVGERSTEAEPTSVLPRPTREYIAAAATTDDDVASLAPRVPEAISRSILENDPTLDQHLAEWLDEESARPKVQMLGPLQILMPGGTPAWVKGRLAGVTEVAVLLACNPGGLPPEQVAETLGMQTPSLHARMSELRRWFGVTPDGGLYVPESTQSQGATTRGVAVYQFDGVLDDAALFRRLRARALARGSAGVDDLITALRLVRGTPFDQQRRNGYGWLADSPEDEYLRVAIVDTAHLVATHGLTEGDAELALWAAEVAIKAAPSEDKPRLDLALALKMLGRIDEALDVIDADVLNRADGHHAAWDASDRTGEIVDRHFNDER